MTTTTDLRGVSGDVTVVEQADHHRYELRLDGEVRGLVVYCDDADVRALVHTEVDAAFQGHGLAGEMVRQVLVDLDRQGRRVQPACGFAAHYIDQHPEFSHLLA